MPDKIYLVMGNTGAYEDYTEWVVTEEGGVIGAYEGTTRPMVMRTQNVAMAKINKDEALALIAALSSAFGSEGVPAQATYEKVWIVLEDPTHFFPKDMD